jgi:signal transduction histidine kinase
MISARIPENESTRLNDLYQSNLLDTPSEVEFDEIVKLASSICNTPISLISLVDSNRQWFKARVGLNVSETNREVSFCSHAILQDQLFEVKDTLQDIRFFDNPLVTSDPSIRFYAGMPLVTSTGNRLGTLCVIDKAPGELSDKQKFGLKVLADNVIKIAELRIKNKELYFLTENQKRIISILAHDVRNPLASIQNIIELKQTDILDADEAAQMMGMVSGQLNNTIAMVENIVNWGQMQLKFGHLHPKDFNLHEMIDRIFDSELLKSKAKGNKLINQTQLSTIIHADLQALEFILRNIISNANKFTEQGMITVGIGSYGLKTILSVTDTGIGMSQEKADALLNTNTFNSTVGTDNEKGSGLGLMLVKEFIERMNGSLTIKSEISRGTCFKITF